MKKHILPIAILSALLLVPGLLRVATADTPDTVTLDYNSKSKKVESFDHKSHAAMMGDDASCVKCHHTLKEGETAAKCSSCHTDEDKEGGAIKIKDAYHKLCKDCHRENKAKKPGIERCKGCHK